LAGWVMVFTTVSEGVLEASTLITLYRTRWQVGLVFKRQKSLLDLDLLRSQQDSLRVAFGLPENYYMPLLLNVIYINALVMTGTDSTRFA